MYICKYVCICLCTGPWKPETDSCIFFFINFYPTYLETGLLVVPELGLTISARLVGQIAS